jgi:(4-alkanoyl-5-oxo-2,5-dihydrofuran-3-yl)methyl phosphate reductase
MIAVTGATGNIGLHLVRMLLDAGQQVRVLARDQARAKTMLRGGVEIIDAASPSALAGSDKAFLLVQPGPDMAATAGAFAEAARAAGVKHIVAISSGTIDMKPTVALGAWHRALEERIEASGLAWTFVRPGNFASNALRWAPTIRRKSTVFATKPDGRSAPIDPYDIAGVAVAALVQPGHEGKTYSVMGPATMSAREQVDVISVELGRDLQIIDAPPEQMRAGLISGGMSPVMADAIVELLGQTDPVLTTTVKDITGNEPRTFATWVENNRRAFAS